MFNITSIFAKVLTMFNFSRDYTRDDIQVTDWTGDELIDQQNPMITLKNMSSTVDTSAIMAHSATADYAIGDLVEKGGKLYRAIVASSSAAFNFTNFILTNRLQEQINIIGKSAILKVLRKWNNQKNVMRSNYKLLEYTKALKVTETNIESLSNTNSGLYFKTIDSKNAITTISNIEVEPVDADVSFVVYVYDIINKGIVQSAALDTTSGYATLVVEDSTIFRFTTDIRLKQGEYYLYITEASTQWNHFVGENNGKFAQSKGVSYSDPLLPTYTDRSPINVTYSVSCDYTDFVLDNIEVFRDAFSKQIQYDLLKFMVMNPHVRVNRHEEQFNADQILFELNGHKDTSFGGLGTDLIKSIKAIELNYMNLDKYCLPCTKKKIMKHIPI